ncbi:MAG: phosphoenolpyruvate carboxykinase (ATP) [Candidatus Fluviicola riflensis]|nr:MAG: phosphoenolpyruvate carboxykinase (ATP) [Candidatus Fluviicola riflensis]OGS78809.1 MAG: phosphoenolpyruvate carboxykinase (ATP) [Candidatus Fluviicola riflensis]OGS85831.1 MAG: phosphoenolpyruvate carboxykinase (ATP) [Fluviicola sp. RIFCSPHIGHO2_12_FULL_43_24]OGS86240.1 MAG: phosphoenolpyruvate carboxykinase (ATP) [Fluviicola sp. RIFCSPHIGHO2_01_FULL_43_53]
METVDETPVEQLNIPLLTQAKKVYYNLSVTQLVEETIQRRQGILTSTGALACDTGEFTGRSPKDKYIVKDNLTENTVWWGDVNQPFSSDDFNVVYNRVIEHLKYKEIFVRDAYACASPDYKLTIRVVTESPWQNLFTNNLFLRPTEEELADFSYEWLIVAAPSFRANPEIDKTRQHNFTIIDFTKKVILIGGSGYTGEIKKGIFTVLNYILPQDKDVLSMHCSANIGEKGDTAIFFGLSGTGKTTLSADPVRKLIGDDEHGWDADSVFNIEGGCYAKCVNLTQEKEPQIFNAIKYGTLLENVNFIPNTLEVDYANIEKTENTRAAYPIDFIENAVNPSIGSKPKNIFFLTCDAFGVLPPLSQLTPEQAMYHFISGYTAKVAGTETGITEPQSTFSACFGKPFLPLHPMKYAEMLGKKLYETKARVWLVNTGWTGGPYGIGERINLKYTRAMIAAVLNGEMDKVVYVSHPVFGIKMPTSCAAIPPAILNPKSTWKDRVAYDKQALDLANQFITNFKLYSDQTSDRVLTGGPTVKTE